MTNEDIYFNHGYYFVKPYKLQKFPDVISKATKVQ